MAIDIVYLAVKFMVIFHCYVNVYQRVTKKNGDSMAFIDDSLS
jgi:hypothetical protein